MCFLPLTLLCRGKAMWYLTCAHAELLAHCVFPPHTALQAGTIVRAAKGASPRPRGPPACQRPRGKHRTINSQNVPIFTHAADPLKAERRSAGLPPSLAPPVPQRVTSSSSVHRGRNESACVLAIRMCFSLFVRSKPSGFPVFRNRKFSFFFIFFF